MKVSVIIPAYNCEKRIEKCIVSVLNQNADTEIIVINDGSTDGTESALRRFGEKIILKSIENAGVANARNVGLAAASGDFIMFLDSDDTLKDGAIEALLKMQAEHDADMVRFRYECVLENSNRYVPQGQAKGIGFVEKNEFCEKVYPMFLDGIRLNSVCMGIYRHRLVDGLRFRTDMKTAEDAVFSLETVTRAKNILFADDVFYEYFRSEGGLTGSGLSVRGKYRDNFKFALAAMSYLKVWEMNSPSNRFRAMIRPIRLTFDKIKRLRLEKAEL